MSASLSSSPTYSSPQHPTADPLCPSASSLSASPSAPPIGAVEDSSALAATSNFAFLHLTPLEPPFRPPAAVPHPQLASSAASADSAGTRQRLASTASGKRPPAPSGSAIRQRSDDKKKPNKSRPRDASRPRTIIGKSVKDGLISVKGADLTVNRYVGRWHNDSTSDAVKNFISKQNVTVVELEELETKHGRFKSFRLRVKKTQLSLIENEDFWPEGVILSPFFRGKDEKQQTVGVAASSSISNG